MFSNLAPKLLGLGFPSIKVRGKDNHIYLTFDDGPDPIFTPQIIRICRDFSIKATFFVLGERIEANGTEIIKELIQDGHTVGSHSYQHRSMLFWGTLKAYNNLKKTDDLIHNATNNKVIWFRPPYGHISLGLLTACRTIEYKIALWSFTPEDWKHRSAKELIQQTKIKIRSGDIVLLHDHGINAHNTVEALPEIIEFLTKKGYTLSNLEEA